MASERRVRILCFGDSNTWGYDPRTHGRYPESVRWTGRLQARLGAGYQILEEGLNGRTTVFDFADRAGRNGKTYLPPAMDSHYPLDAMILCLGTNDTKVELGNSAEDIAAGLEQLIEIALGKGLERPSPGLHLIVAAPPLVAEAHLDAGDAMMGSAAKTRALPALYRALAAKHGCHFVDFSAVAPPSEADGCHLDPDAHAAIAEVLHAKLVEILAR